MQIQIVKEDLKLPKGTTINVLPNSVNRFVGLNGSGKTICFSALADFLVKRLKLEGNWMTPPPKFLSNQFKFEGFSIIKHIIHFTAKSRQSQFIDLDIAFTSAAGANALNLSEGMNCQAELAKLLSDAISNPEKDKKTLYIFDEIDGPLDPRAKSIFFDQLLPKLKGTVVVCTHDCFFLGKKDVFDFTDGSVKSAVQYFTECSTKKFYK